MAKPKPTLNDAALAKLSYEQALEKLESLLDRVESGDIGLEDALAQCEAGNQLIAHCRGILDRVQQRVEQLKTEAGTLTSTDDDND